MVGPGYRTQPELKVSWGLEEPEFRHPPNPISASWGSIPMNLLHQVMACEINMKGQDPERLEVR